MKNVFIAGPAEITLYDALGQLISKSKTMLNTSITVETSAEDIRGGFGNKLLGRYFHDSNFSMELEDSMFRMEWIASALGASLDGGNGQVPFGTSETVELKADGGDGNLTGTVKNTPIAIGEKIEGWIEKEDGGFLRVEFTGKDFNITKQVANDNKLMVGSKVCLTYNYNADNAQVMTISANIIPDEVHAVARCQLFAGSVKKIGKSSRVGFVEIDIPRFQLSGGTTLSLTNSGASTTPLSGSALAVDTSAGCEEDGYYAKITKVEEGAKWYDNANYLAIDDAEIELQTNGKSDPLYVLAFGPMMGSGYRVPASALTFESSSNETATVDGQGVITGVKAGHADVKVFVTEKPSLLAIATVTVK